VTIGATIRTFVTGALLLAPFSAVHAVTVDFTGDAWSGVNGTNNHSIGTGITLSSVGGSMTFNSSDGAAGCGNANKLTIIATTGLECTGDGIGIGNDEITQGGNQSLTVTFDDGPVNIHAIHFLDLFARESTGEKAVIQWATGPYEAHATPAPFNEGGYWEINKGPSAYDGGLAMAGITSFTLTGFDDGFSDYALARIEFSAVPIPSAFWMFGTALIGFVAMSRRIRV
jgi:hypothetical protein